MKKLLKWSFLLSVICLSSLKAFAQHDSSYFASYTDQITGRFYFSQKYTNLMVEDQAQNLDLEYRPNTTLNMGIGASYKWFTLNLAYGFPFLNKEKEKGDTRYLDLQAHFYGNTSNIDLFGQFYNGFYLYPSGKASSVNQYYIRPDIKVREYGGSYQHIFNHKRFSYRASFLQNEWQKKSAGSFLFGAEFFIGKVGADSTVYPAVLTTSEAPKTTKVFFYELGPNFGYAYTLIIAKHFFLTGSLSFSLDYNVTEYKYESNRSMQSGVTPNSLIRVFTGYNSKKSALSVTFTNSRVSLAATSKNSVALNTGNFRINYVRRFIPGPKTKKILAPIGWFSK